MVIFPGRTWGATVVRNDGRTRILTSTQAVTIDGL